ncbi:MAG: hypothetical protein B7X99_03650 [Rhizobiales bacterium 17-65-6]|nr:MAG: hypothetical protein B7X99_03650 [Rhizobiales bacterium 17-65-6]
MRRSGRVAVAMGAMLISTGAMALLAPEYYQKARENAPDVVVLKIDSVGAPPDPAGFGMCRVEGVVAQVQRGTRHAVGAPLTLAVPCRRQGAQPPLGPVLWNGFDELRAAPYGRAWLEADGTLALHQYEMLQALP